MQTLTSKSKFYAMKFESIQINCSDYIKKNIIQRRLHFKNPADICIINIYSKKKFTLIDKKEENRTYSFSFFGIQIYPQTLSVFSNSIIANFQNPLKYKSQCIFYIKNSFDQNDMIVEITIPGGIKLSILQKDRYYRSVKKQDLQECYVSSILRYMLSIIYESSYEKGFTRDPFNQCECKFIDFLNLLFKIVKSKDIEINLDLWIQELRHNIKNSLNIVKLYIKITKRADLLVRYFEEQIQKDQNYINKNLNLVQFYIEVFLTQNHINQSIHFQPIKQLLCVLNYQKIMSRYYMSCITHNFDQQIELLKAISYANKNQIWLKLASLYLSQKYFTHELIIKGMSILNLLADKIRKQNKNNISMNNRINHKSYYGSLSYINGNKQYFSDRLDNNPKLDLFSEIQRYPTKFNSLLNKNMTINLIESPQTLQPLQKLRKNLEKYKSINQIQQQIVKKILKLISSIGNQRFSEISDKTFIKQNHNIDCIQMFDSPQDNNISFQDTIQQHIQDLKYPSFINQQTKDIIMNTSISQFEHKQNLARITQETILTLRDENLNSPPTIYIKQNSQYQYTNIKILTIKQKKLISSNFLELLNLALNIKKFTEESLKKLNINPKQFKPQMLGNLNTLSCMIIAQACQLCNMMLISIYAYIFIKKRIIDMYTYYKLLKHLVEVKDCKTLLLLLSDLITDLRMLGIKQIYYLPIWAQEEYFNIIAIKGRVLIQIVLKQNKISEPIIWKSLQKYFVSYK